MLYLQENSNHDADDVFSLPILRGVFRHLLQGRRPLQFPVCFHAHQPSSENGKEFLRLSK